MGKSENLRYKTIIENYFKKGDKISKKHFEQLFLTEDSETLENLLFSFLYDEVESISHDSDINYLFKAFLYIETLVERYSDIDKKKIKRKLRKIIEKIETIEDENSGFKTNKKMINRVDKLKELIYDLYDRILVKKDNYYELLEYFIFEIKKISYIEKIFKTFDHTIKAKSLNGETIFCSVIEKYIEVIKDSKSENQDDILYFKNVISLMRNIEGFNLSNSEKSKLLHDILININLLNKKDKRYKEQKELLIELKEIIKNENDRVTINKIANYYNIDIDFEDSILEELKIQQSKYKKFPNRKVIDDYMITIDGRNTYEIDDGLTAKVMKNGNYLLGVHIASVLAYLPFESSLVQNAISKGSSIYLAKNGIYSKDENKVIPLFPYDFSTRDASLIEGEYRLANSYFFEIDKNGNIINETYEKTIVKNKRQCTYNEANNIIEYGSKNEYELENILHLLSEIAYVLDNRYHPSEIYQAMKSQSNDPAKVILGSSTAEHIVNQTMVLTGSEVGNWFKDPKRSYPCLLRVHQINNDTVKKLQESIESFIVNSDKERFERLFESLSGIYPKAYYDLSGRHDGMNLDNYCHVTSPLRRSADILQEYALDICYFNKPTDSNLYELERLLTEKKNIINARNNSIDYFLDDCRFQKKLLYKAK